MNKILSLAGLTVLAGAAGLCAGPEFPPGKVWTQTQYFVENFSASDAVPRPASHWKMYSRLVVESAPPLMQIDQQLGAETPRRTWFAGDAVVQRDPDGRLIVLASQQYDLPEKLDVSWTKDKEPVAKVRHEAKEVLVFDVPDQLGGGRVWVEQTSGEALALWRRKFVTVVTVEAGSSPLQLPADARAAIEAKSQKAKAPTRTGAKR